MCSHVFLHFLNWQVFACWVARVYYCKQPKALFCRVDLFPPICKGSTLILLVLGVAFDAKRPLVGPNAYDKVDKFGGTIA